MNAPSLSVVLVAYDMRREVPRTVESLLAPYQRDLPPGTHEVIVVENGSTQPLTPEVRASWPTEVRYLTIDPPTPTPAHALNAGVGVARADLLCLLVDGARMASPRLLAEGLDAVANVAAGVEPVVVTLGFHLGDSPQQQSTLAGYGPEAEDRLLASIGWPVDGHRLFEIACLAPSSRHGWRGPLAESNCIFVRRGLYSKVGGFDPAFSSPGGGLVNHDFLIRCLERPGIEYLLLAGEATFHQVHGGISTNPGTKPDHLPDLRWEDHAAEYRRIRGVEYRVPSRLPRLFGDIPTSVRHSM